MLTAFPARDLPILYECDVFVLGAGFTGLAAAVRLAGDGHAVAVVEPRTYPGREMTAKGKPYVTEPGFGVDGLPEPLASAWAAARDDVRGNGIPVHEDRFKKSLEDSLRHAGVKIYYASLPVGLVRTEDNGIGGVIVGNKSGRQVIRCQYVIDASETALIARLLGEEFETPPPVSLYQRRLEFTGVAELATTTLTVPVAGIRDQTLAVYPGLGGDGHYWLEYAMELPRGTDSALDQTWRDRAARLQGLAVVTYLKNHHASFHAAVWASSSHELDGPATAPLKVLPQVPPIPDASNLPGPESQSRQPFRVRAPRVLIASGAARGTEAQRERWSSPAGASELGVFIARLVALPPRAIPLRQDGLVAAPGPALREQARPQRGVAYATVPAGPEPLSASEPYDVIVVGGGTAGGIAGITARQAGMQTLLVDMNPGLGGTGTYGGIHAYWFGNRSGFSRQVTAMVDDLHVRTGHPQQKGPVPRWNIECKIHALLESAYTHDLQLLLNAMFIGSLVEEQTVTGVVIATRLGPLAIRGRITIDATGDGDVAACAGAPYVLGSDRDHSLMYSYLPQVIKPGRPRNVKTRSVDITNVEDYTRGIMAERRNSEEGDVDHGIYMAPRESRHIQGDITLTLSDQLVKRAFPDVVLRAFSNNDIKGQSTSDWVLMGLQSPHLDIEIPWSALIPRNVENVIVSGKAFSATHDALAAPRMQPDMENLGGVAAVAAAMAVEHDIRPRDLPVRALQERLVAADVLPSSVLNRQLAPLRFTRAELDRMLDRIDPDVPLHKYSFMQNNVRYEGRVELADMMCSGPAIVPYLEERYDQAPANLKLLLAQVLAVLGSAKGVDRLVDACLADLQGDRLPVQDETIMYKGIPPDQNAAANVAFMIYSLGLARDRRALPVWRRVVDLLIHETPTDVMDKDRSMYYYVTAVCFGVERLGDPDCVEMLERLHRYEPFYRKHTSDATALEVDYVDERLAYLELVIGRSLARCGSPAGYVLLIGYLADVRALHAEHAHTELVSITGEDFGKDQARWSDWLEHHADRLPAVPYTEPSDPVKTWNEEILIEPVPAG